MPRNTRAAARAGPTNNNIHEDEEAGASGVPLPETPQRGQTDRRPPLGDVTNTLGTPQEEQQRTIVLEVNLDKPANKDKNGNAKGKKKGRPGKKDKTQAETEDSRKENTVGSEVLEDDAVSQTSSAVSEACEDLRLNGNRIPKSESPVRDGPRTPQSHAVQRVRKLAAASRPQTPRFDPQRHVSPTGVRKPCAVLADDDSFAHDISSRSPAKPFAALDVDMQDASQGAPVHVAPCTTSSLSNKATPSLTPTRIEDRVEALEALEDALNEIHADLAQNEQRMLAELDSPIKEGREGNASADIISAAIAAATAAAASAINAATAHADAAAAASAATATTPTIVTMKPQAAEDDISAQGRKITATEEPNVTKKQGYKTLRGTSRTGGSGAASRSATTSARFDPNTPLTPRLAPAAKVSAARSTAATRRASSVKASNQSVALTHRPKPQPSTVSGASSARIKPSRKLSVSTFVLPGEAVAAKLKTLREEREKRMSLGRGIAQEDSAAQVARSETKPRTPAPVRKAATVRETKASHARASVLPGSPAKSAPSAAADTLRKAATIGRTGGKTAAPSVQAVVLKSKASMPSLASKTRPGTLPPKARPTVAATVRAANRVSSSSTTATHVAGVARSTLKSPIKAPAPARLLAAFEPPVPAVPGAQGVTSSASASAVGIGARAKSSRPQSTVGASVPSRTGTVLLRARRAAEEERRAKEDAAKKARAEAAERGRLASREWAERQRARAEREKARKSESGSRVVADKAPKEVLVVEMADV